MHALLDQGLTIIKEIFDKMAFGINAVIIKKVSTLSRASIIEHSVTF